MPFQIVRNDITKMEVDAIVNAANKTLLGGGGVDGAIHRAAGIKLKLECAKLHGCKVGEAKITKGYNLPAKYVIHTVGPVWHGGNENEPQLLKNAYENSLKLALENNCESVAFPLISCGVYGYPKADGIKIATEAIKEFLELNDIDMMVYLVVFNKDAFEISNSLFENVKQYITDNYVDEFEITSRLNACECSVPLEEKSMAMPMAAAPKISSIDDGYINDMLDESFSESLLRMIDERGMTDPECYKKANIDRKLFNKIKNNPAYRPTKQTAIAFAIALELDLDETDDFLTKAGYTLSHSNKFDIIIEYFIINGIYNIFEINEALFEFDQALLG